MSDDLMQENLKLRGEIETLKELVRQLQDALIPTEYDFRDVFGFTQLQNNVFTILVKAKGDIVPMNRILTALYSHRESNMIQPDSRVIDVTICQLRKILAPRGIYIQTMRPLGRRLDAISREIAMGFLEQYKEEAKLRKVA